MSVQKQWPRDPYKEIFLKIWQNSLDNCHFIDLENKSFVWFLYERKA